MIVAVRAGLSLFVAAMIAAPLAAEQRGPAVQSARAVRRQAEPPAPRVLEDDCPSADELRQSFRPLSEVSIDIRPSEGDRPPDCSLEYFPGQLEHGDHLARDWGQTLFTWQASALCHKPLYFEEMALERYGHTCCECFQPLVSAAHFFGTVPLLPYKMTLEPPCECVYALGYYRPGSCAPRICYPFPIRCDAAAVESGAVLGLILLVP